MKLLIAGDSLSMSRYTDSIFFEDIYPVRMQLCHPDWFVHNGSERSNSSGRICSADYLDEHVRPLAPDLIVLQVGVVDCTPRIFSARERGLLKIMQRTPLIKMVSSRIIACASKNRYKITRARRLPYVRPLDFKSNIIAFLEEARLTNSATDILIINIAKPGGLYLSRNYNALSQVGIYNSILNEIADQFSAAVIDLYSFTSGNPGALLADGYHINAMAHRFLAEQLAVRIAAIRG